MLKNIGMLIEGAIRGGGIPLEVVNPANEEVIARCGRATPSDAADAVAAARRAWPAWRDTPLAVRRQTLLRIADAVDQNANELTELVTLEQGKPLKDAAIEVQTASGVLRYFAESDFAPHVVQDDGHQRAEIHRRPLGVVVAITAWNFPLLMGVYKLAPALIAGNTFVLKPSPTTPLSSLRFCELIADIVPAGVVNVLVDGGDIGPILTSHPDVAKVSFTGSTTTGRSIMRSASETLKRLTLELGGNDAAIVLDDVDVKAVARQIFGLAFVNSGQVCMSIKRIYVQSAIYDEMCDELAVLANAAKVGDGRHAETQFGPLQNRRQFDVVKELLEEAPRYGKVIAGGRAWGPGYFVQPTLVRDITEGNRLVDEEVFGPLRSVLKFDTVDEAVQRANSSSYGLGASVWSRDTALATQVASRLEAGSAWVNQHFAVAPHIPFGGVKQSGIGVEFSREGLYEYTYAQSVVVAKDPVRS